MEVIVVQFAKNKNFMKNIKKFNLFFSKILLYILLGYYFVIYNTCCS